MRPEHFLFGAVTSLVFGYLMQIGSRPQETEGGSTMEMYEILAYSEGEVPAALDLMESSLEMGQKARITICTEALPTQEELEDLYWAMIAEGFHASQPTAFIAGGISTTEFDLEKGSPAFVAVIPLIVPILTIGLIVFGITQIETIARVLVPVMIITFGGLIILALAVRKPAMKYLERGGERARLPATSKKVVAAR